MFEDFAEFNIKTSPDPEVCIYGKISQSRSGPPLLLLHGYPQTHLIWHYIAPSLAKTYTVVVMDLRGYGASSKPFGASDHSTYSKRVMAKDCIEVMSHLGFQKFFVCAHDRGARVTHKLCVDFPDRVQKALLLDIAPTAAMYSGTNDTFARAYYHWFFLIQKAPFPEKLISGDPDAFMDAHMGSRYAGLAVFTDECMRAYRAAMRDPGTVHATCEDYRAAASIDLEENAQDLKAGRKIKCPLMILWGSMGAIEKCFDALGEWTKVSDAEVSGESLNCGHYIPEERPDELLQEIKKFLVD